MTLIPKNPTSPYPPPDGYSYREPKTGRYFNGLEGNVEVTARKVIEFRLANPHIFAEGGGDFNSTIQEIYRQKHATHPHLFLGEAEQSPQATQESSAGKCECGSTEFVPTYCASCGGSKINGWKCKSCGRPR